MRTITTLGVGVVDGLRMASSGDYPVFHWEGQVYRISPSGDVVEILDTLPQARNSADFELIREKGMLIVPTFKDNRVVAYEIRPHQVPLVDRLCGMGRRRTGKRPASRCRTQSRDPGRHTPWWLADSLDLFWLTFLPFVLAAAVFLPLLQNQFVYDDQGKIDLLPNHLPTPLWRVLFWNRGVTYLSQVVDKQIWGSWPPGFHLTNVLLHALASALAARVAFSLSRSRRLGLLAGLFFAVHPVHVEAVASFVNRKDILAMVFVACALLFWRGGRYPVLDYAAAMICYALAMFSKEVAAVALAPILFLVDLLPDPERPKPWRTRLQRAVLRFGPLVFVATAMTVRFAGGLAKYFSRESIYERTSRQMSSYEEVLTNVAAAVPELVRLSFFPWRLSADYPVYPGLDATHPRAVLGIVLFLTWVGLAVVLWRRVPLAGFAMTWVVAFYVPVSNVVPLIHFFVAERYLYVPSFGICLLLACALERLLISTAKDGFRCHGLVVICLAVSVIFLATARCLVRNADWRDPESLWKAALSAGYETRRIHNNLGISHVREKRFDDAVVHFRKAWELDPTHLRTRRMLLDALMTAGRGEEVRLTCRRILEKRSDDLQCHNLLGIVAVDAGRESEALRHFEDALAQRPADLGALTNLARIRAAAKQSELRDPAEAVRLSERARRLSGGRQPEILLVLSISYRASEDFAEAQRWGRKARDLAESLERGDLLPKIDRHLDSMEIDQDRQARP